MEGEALRRLIRTWYSVVASVCALAVTLALMSLADPGRAGLPPERIFDFGAGPGADHSGDGNAMFPGATGRRPVAFSAPAPVVAGSLDTPELVVARVADPPTTTTTTTLPAAPSTGALNFTTAKKRAASAATSTRRKTVSTTKRIRTRHRRPARVRRVQPKPRRTRHVSGACRFS